MRPYAYELMVGGMIALVFCALSMLGLLVVVLLDVRSQGRHAATSALGELLK